MSRRELFVLLGLLAVAFALSAWQPADWPTWWMEVAPVFLALPIVLLVNSRIGLTRLSLMLLAFECLIVAVGAHYTYAHVPLGFWASGLLGLERNHYDRFAHLFQGIAPTLAMRELLLRTSPLRPGKWLSATLTSMCLAMAAIYELVEWAAAVVFGGGAIEFLGTQGDPWDTQWDMFLALCGTILTQILLTRTHDRQMRELAERGR